MRVKAIDISGRAYIWHINTKKVVTIVKSVIFTKVIQKYTNADFCSRVHCALFKVVAQTIRRMNDFSSAVYIIQWIYKLKLIVRS